MAVETPLTGLRSAGHSHPGLRRGNNEDRFYCNRSRGIFLLVDGMGGEAAGEKAAETAIAMLRGRLERPTGSVIDRIREAIALANNEIFRLASINSQWQGMACVLTVAVIEGDTLTVGHVGDSRAYVFSRGKMRKITHDHSPVGEREDSGELTEAEAMQHPRRNEVFRDVGSGERTPDEEDFIEIIEQRFASDMAVLLCSDGLSDLVTAEIISGTVRASQDASEAVQALVDAANAAGGKDNVTVVLIEGAAFREFPLLGSGLAGRWAFLIYGAILMGLLAGGGWLWLAAKSSTAAAPALPVNTVVAVAPCPTVAGIVKACEGVSLTGSGTAVTGVVCEGVQHGRIAGFQIAGRVVLRNCGVSFEDNEVVGGGIDIDGTTTSVLRGNRVLGSSGAGIVIGGSATPKLVHNVIAGNGKRGLAGRPSIEIYGAAAPEMTGNTFIESLVEPVWSDHALTFPAGNFTGLAGRVRVMPQGSLPNPE